MADDYFYRYRSLSGESLEWVRRSILHSQHHFSAPFSFNDPFDCRPNFALNGTKDQIVKYYEAILSRRCPEMSRQERRIDARRRVSDPEFDPRNPANFAKFRSMYHEQVTARVGVLCISEVPDDLLMWAHYADSHKGICLALNRSNPFFATAHPVKYQKLRPEVNPLVDSHEEMLDRSMFTKSDHWSYEKEWRILQYKSGAATYTLPTEALAGIVLGAQIDSAHERQIFEWASASPSKPWVRRASLSSTQFSLSIA